MTWSYFRSADGPLYRRDRGVVEALTFASGWVLAPEAFDWFYDPGYMTLITVDAARAIAQKDGVPWPTT